MPIPDTNDSDGPKVTKTVTFSEKDIKAAARLFRLLADPILDGSGMQDAAPVARDQDRQILVSRARLVFESRRMRERYFDRDIFGEPAWDILLLLYVAEQSAGRLTMTRLAEQVHAPLTTVGRWLNHLEAHHYVAREAHPPDRRTIFIRLVDKGRSALDGFLGSIAG